MYLFFVLSLLTAPLPFQCGNLRCFVCSGVLRQAGAAGQCHSQQVSAAAFFFFLLLFYCRLGCWHVVVVWRSHFIENGKVCSRRKKRRNASHPTGILTVHTKQCFSNLRLLFHAPGTVSFYLHLYRCFCTAAHSSSSWSWSLSCVTSCTTSTTPSMPAALSCWLTSRTTCCWTSTWPHM